MAYVVPTDLHTHMRSDVARLRLVSVYETDPMSSFEGFTITRMGFLFKCPEFPGDHKIIVPYDWDEERWVLSLAKATRELPPELYGEALSLISKESPFRDKR